MVTLEKGPKPTGPRRWWRGRWGPIAWTVSILFAVVAMVIGLATETKTPEGGSVQASAAVVDPWPFTVPSGLIACHHGAVSFTAAGKQYAVNDAALAAGLPDVGPLRAADPDRPGLKLPLDEAIRLGLALCQ